MHSSISGGLLQATEGQRPSIVLGEPRTTGAEYDEKNITCKCGYNLNRSRTFLNFIVSRVVKYIAQFLI